MSYEYDAGSTRLLVEQDKTMDGVTPLALVQAMDLGLGTVAVAVKPEDAPAVALAILEAAGYSDGETENPDRAPESDAVWHLRKALKHRAVQAEQEAEDAKVREFVRAIPGVSYLDESPEHWQVLYRAAREHFTRTEKPAPRVLNYGDPEPESGTWRSNNDVLYQKDPGGWATVNGCYSVLWSHFNAGAFPMTEVTE